MILKYSYVADQIDWDVFADIHFEKSENYVTSYIYSYVEDRTFQEMTVDNLVQYPITEFINGLFEI